jgi:hypothetical protein
MKPKLYLAAGVVLTLAFVLVLGTAAAQPASPCDIQFITLTGNTIRVSPTGVDDTANIQCAFDWAIDRGPGMTVRLTPGTFHTAQIYVYDFYGSFRGSGADKTVIVNLPNLFVTPVNGWLNPPSSDNPLAILFSFINGRVVIADLAIHIDDHDGHMTTGWAISGDWGSYTFYEMDMAIVITGTKAEALVTRILIEGEPLANYDVPYSLRNGIYYQGLYNEGLMSPVTGAYRVTNSTFKTMGSGTPLFNLKDASILVSHNRYEDGIYMMDVADFVDSTIEIASNQGETLIGMTFDSGWLPEITGTRIVVRNNEFAGNYGVIFWDTATFGVGNTCLIKSNDFRQILEGSVLLLGPGTDQCVLKNNKE